MIPPSSSQSALRRLLVVITIVIGFMIYAYGWTVTNIDLETPQEPSRQQNVSNALRELLSPRLFEQAREQVTSTAAILVDCETGGSPAMVEGSVGEAYIIVEPTCGSAGDVVAVRAYNFSPGAHGSFRWIPASGQSRPRPVIGTGQNTIILDEMGSFQGEIEIPRISGSSGQQHAVGFIASVPAGPVYFSETTNEVVRRMVETIFMALVATSLAIPVAAALSFFAARNLMRSIRLPLGGLLVTVIALPIGWWLGSLLMGAVGRFGVNLGSGELLNAASATLPLVFLVGTTVASRSVGGINPTPPQTQARNILSLIAIVIAVVFVVGLAGGLGILGGEQLINIGHSFRPSQVDNLGGWLVNALGDGVAGVGRFIEILGRVIELFIVPFAGILGAFLLASIAGRIITPVLRYTSTTVSHIAGGVLGALGGAIVMAGIAAIGMSAALMGLLPPLMAGLLGGQAASTLYQQLVGEIHPSDQLKRTGRNLAFLVGAVAAFTVTFQLLNIGRALVDGILPSAEPSIYLQLPMYIAESAGIGLLLGGLVGGLIGIHSNFMFGNLLYNITRTVLNATRSIEPLIMGLIFVIWVGIGPFAGVLALTLHSIASLGKLYSEQIENIDEGPLEALRSTGANQLQTIIYAVVPQIVPPYIAFTMYRWDINVRMSTIIGFVGGGGIGLLLNQQINLLRYRDAGVAVLAIAIVVSILDYASASIRERYI